MLEPTGRKGAEIGATEDRPVRRRVLRPTRTDAAGRESGPSSGAPADPPPQHGPEQSREVQPAEPTAREPRGTRRKRETRARLMRAAHQLMADEGVEDVAINEITEAADVGFGSFYNHFHSKEAIYLAVVEEVYESVGAALEQMPERLEDPAEVVAACTRHALLRVRQEPVWGRFLMRTAFSNLSFAHGLGPGLIRILVNGVMAGRFEVVDPSMTYVAAAGILLAAIQTQLQHGRLDLPEDVGFSSLGLEREDFPERTAAVLLRLLGLPPGEADAVARRPLPSFEALPA